MLGIGQQKRRWGKGRKRAVSPIIATILLVAITVVLAAVLYILISGLTKGPGNTPIGTALAMQPAKEGSAGTSFWYNFTVSEASGGLTWSNVVFQFQTSTGGIVTLAAPTYNVYGIGGFAAGAVATWSGTSWTLGATLGISNQQVLVVKTTSNLQSAGDVMVILGSGSFSGSTSATIP